MKQILFYDIEITGILGWTYSMYEARVHKVEQQPIMLSFSYQWLGDKKIYHENLSNQTEEELVTKLRDLFEEAEVLVAHNANKFDNRVAVGKFLQFGLTPPQPYKTVDTLRVARGVAKLPSNSLDALCDLFGIGRKSSVTHADLWFRCLQGDKKAWAQMRIYNNQDVNLLRELYLKLLPYIKNHPNMGDINQIDGVCPKCGSKELQRRGKNKRRNGEVQRYQCQSCGGWCNESNLRKLGRTVNA